MQKHRFLALATTAVAATVAFSVLVSTPNGAAVQASTIFASFQQSLLNGFDVEYQNIGNADATMSGRLQVEFEQFDPAQTEPTLRAVYADGSIQTTDAFSDFPGLDFDYALSLNDADPWIFAQAIGGPPDTLVEDQPWVPFVWGMLNNGLLLDLAGVWEGFEDEPAMPPAQENDEEDQEVVTMLTFGDLPESDGPGVTAQTNFTLSFGGADDAEPADPAVRSGSAVSIQPNEMLAGDEAQLIEDLLYGRASAEQVAQLVGLLESAAGTVAITELTPGEYRLVATDFDFPDDEAWLESMVLELDYITNVGLTRARVTNVSANAGSLEIRPLPNTGIDPTLTDRSNWISPGTYVFDLGALEQMFGG